MPDNISDFRERLLSAQPMTSTLRDEYRKELDVLLNHRLTPRTRFYTVAAMLGSLAFAAFACRGLILHHDKPGMRVLLPTYAILFTLTAGWLGKVLWQGGFSRRGSFAVVEWLGGIFVGAYLTVVLFTGMFHPNDPASTYSAVWAVLLTIVGFAWATGNRIAASTLETREHLLRLESRLADLAERLPK